MFGLINATKLGILAKAFLNRGAYFNGELIKLNEGQNLSNCHLAFDYGYTQREKQINKTLIKVANKIKYCFSYASTGVSLLYFLGGKIDGYIHSNISLWDVAAGDILVREAGGKVTDFNKNPLNYDFDKNKSVIFCKEKIHEELVHILS